MSPRFVLDQLYVGGSHRLRAVWRLEGGGELAVEYWVDHMGRLYSVRVETDDLVQPITQAVVAAVAGVRQGLNEPTLGHPGSDQKKRFLADVARRAAELLP